MRDGATARSWRLRGLGAIAHPVALVALVTLVVHDAFLRPMLPTLVAGKVSDIAGLVLFPLVLATMVATLVRDDDTVLLAATAVTVVWFAAMKLAPVAADVTIALAEVVTPRAQVTPDGTDLLALPAVLAAAWVWRHRVPQRAWASPVLVLAVLWSAATSCEGPLTARAVVVLDDGSFHVDLDGWDAVVDPAGDVETGVERPAGLPDDGDRRQEVCLADGTCVRAVEHDLAEKAPDGTVTTVVDIPEDRFDYAQRTRGGCGPTDYEPVQDMAANGAGVVVVAHGSHGVSVRTADGVWTRPDVGGTLFTGPLPVEFVTAAVALTLLGLLLLLWPAGWFQVLSWSGAVAAAGTAVAVVAGPISLIVGWPVLLGVAMVVALHVGLAAGTRGAGPVLREVGAVLLGGWVAYVLVWAWSAGWIDSMPLTLLGMVLAVVTPTMLLVDRGRAAGSWPVRVAGEDAAPPPNGVA